MQVFDCKTGDGNTILATVNLIRPQSVVEETIHIL